jgi:hypothetical protein
MFCRSCLFVLLVLAGSTSAGARDKPAILRWVEGQPGCTFSADDDGKYRYGLWTGDFGIVLAVDADELRKASLRTEPTLTVFLTARYRGKDALAINSDEMSLEFVKHDHEVQMAENPDELARRFQADADRFEAQVQKEIAKHPDRKTEKESQLQTHRANVSDMLEFLRTRSLRPITMDPVHADAGGWVFFSSKSKWIGDWKKQEQFILRIPLQNEILEFPFALPPSEGDLLLRRR